MPTGHCHCGSVRYRLTGEPVYTGVCHCADCRRHSGAVMVGWTAYPTDALTVESGDLTDYASSERAVRQFCSQCGTGLFYRNEAVLPGLVDVQLTTLDDPENYAPQVHVQMADALAWEAKLPDLPAFDRYPEM